MAAAFVPQKPVPITQIARKRVTAVSLPAVYARLTTIVQILLITVRAVLVP